jgi:hypothetical protein
MEIREWSLSKINAFKGCRRYFSRRYGNVPPENPEPMEFLEGLEFHRTVGEMLKGIEQNDLNIPEKYITPEWELEKKLSGEIDGYKIVGYADAFLRLSPEHVVFAEIKSYPSSREEILFQLGVYINLLVEEELNLPLATFLSITPRGVIEETYEPDQYLKYGKKVTAIIEWIEREIREFPETLERPNPGATCLKCQWRTSCPALAQNPTLKEVTENPDLLAQRILSLELELNELKEIARAVVESGGRVSTGEGGIEYTFEFYEEIEADPLQIYNYLVEHRVNPFSIPLGRTPKSILKVDTRVLRDYARKYDPDITNLISVKINKRFTRRKINEQEE